MLKNISPVLSPALLKILCEMGHGDEIVLADAHFPAKTTAQGHAFVGAHGIGMRELLEAILPLFPLDTVSPFLAFFVITVPLMGAFIL